MDQEKVQRVLKMGRGSGKSGLPALLALMRERHGMEIKPARLVIHDFDHIIVDEFIPLELGNHLIAQRRLGRSTESAELGTRIHRGLEEEFFRAGNAGFLIHDCPITRDFIPTPKVPSGKYHPQFHNEERPVAQPMRVDYKKVAKNRAAAKRAKKARRK